MLRAIKFAARLDFRLADDVYEAIIDCRHEVDRAAPSRLFEEILRLLNLGGACASVRLLLRTGLLAILMPELAAAIESMAVRADSSAWDEFWATLREFDAAVRSGERVTNARIIATLFMPLFEKEIEGGAALNGGPDAEDGLTPAALKFRMARRDLADARRILHSQRRFVPSAGRRARIEHLRAREGFEDSWFLFTLRSRARGRELMEEHAALSSRLGAAASRS